MAGERRLYASSADGGLPGISRYVTVTRNICSEREIGWTQMNEQWIGANAVRSELGLQTRARTPGTPLRDRTYIRVASRRRTLLRRALVTADIVGLTLAFVAAQALTSPQGELLRGIERTEALLYVAVLPVLLLLAAAQGLYRGNARRAEFSTVEDVAAVLAVLTTGAWLLVLAAWAIDAPELDVPGLALFWVLGAGLVTLSRGSARAVIRRHPGYVQRTVIVGAGTAGQSVARKLVKHPEYGINVLGFADSNPKELGADVERLPVLGPAHELASIVRTHRAERVVFAFSRTSDEETRTLVRSIQDLDVQIDIVPRLFDVIGPGGEIHTVEALPLVGLPTMSASRVSALVKRALDVAGAAIGLVVTAPLFALVAWRIKRDSPGPVLFRQTRLTAEMREFTALKFRTMEARTDQREHREYVRAQMAETATPAGNGLFKLEREGVVTPVGRWLRRTSLDELPQLVNVLRGEMSLVGPRPCIPYETEHFQPHHFDRFRVRAGLTGLWQVTARANVSFAEALDMDVAYVRSASLGLDFRLLCRTPAELLRQRRRTA